MPAFVALLKGVNVGTSKRVPMAELRALLEGLGHERVATLLNSGNAVFRSSRRQAVRLADEIHEGIKQRLGVEAAVIVKPAAEFDQIVADNPLAGDGVDPSRLLVAFTQDPASLPALDVVTPHIVPPERFFIGDRAAYLHFASGILESRAGEVLLGKAGRGATTRNWATVLKLQALLAEASRA